MGVRGVQGLRDLHSNGAIRLHHYYQPLKIIQGGFSMFRLWAKEFKDNRMLRDTVIEVDNDDTRTHKIFHAIDEVCHEFDLSNPIWLDSNIDEFKRHAKTRFHQDNFVDSIEFDYLEIHIIEE